MPAALRRIAATSLIEQLRDASTMSPPLMRDVIAQSCRRVGTHGSIEHTSRIMRLIDDEAWTDAALALIKLELPMWQVRRIAYDEGEWHCALSRERELPDWLDAAVEARHADFAIALLLAFVEVRTLAAVPARPSVPLVRQPLGSIYAPLACDNFS